LALTVVAVLVANKFAFSNPSVIGARVFLFLGLAFALGAALIAVTGYQILLAAMVTMIAPAATYVLTRPEQRQARRRPTCTSLETTAASRPVRLAAEPDNNESDKRLA